MAVKIFFENDSLIDLLDEIETKIPQAIPVAVEKMAATLRKKLINAAPYDNKNHQPGTKHLKEAIRATKVRRKNGEYYTTFFVSPRGLKNAKNHWDKDKYIFKLVVSEYGSSKQEKKPWWKPTIKTSEDELAEIAEEIIKGAIENAQK